MLVHVGVGTVCPCGPSFAALAIQQQNDDTLGGIEIHNEQSKTTVTITTAASPTNNKHQTSNNNKHHATYNNQRQQTTSNTITTTFKNPRGPSIAKQAFPEI
jgi:hypothetical protein